MLTGFASVVAHYGEAPFPPDGDGGFHVPHLTDSAVERILASGLGLVALNSTTVEAQTGTEPVRFSSDSHHSLLGHDPPVMIVEGLGGAGLIERLGFAPEEALLHVVPRRVNEAGADAAHSRVFLYIYRGDDDGAALRRLARTLTVEEMYG